MNDKIANVENSLRRMTDAWNYYFLESKFCQNKINYNDEVRTNYYGDILSYFYDTLSFLHVNQAHLGRKESIFNSISLLQIIYAQQDLIDELLYIFKLPAGLKEDKNHNRAIRNELVGHPIRRLNGELVSSIFFGNEFKGNIIHYIIYSKDNGFKLKEEIINIEKIVARHLEFLIKYLDIIISKIKNILNQLRRKIYLILSMLDTGVEFSGLLTVVEHNYEKVFEDNILFKPRILKEIHHRADEHPRYKNVIDLFSKTLRDYIKGAEDSIDAVVLPELIKEKELEIPKIIIKIVKSKSTRNKKTVERRYFDYEFSKLYESHPMFEVNYFMKVFNGDALIMDELSHMQKFINCELEYYCSCEYLKIIMIEKGLLNRRS